MLTTEYVASRTVLVIDDDADIREVMCAALRCAGCIAIGAESGMEAIVRLHDRQTPGLILLDLDMPAMSGAEFRRQQREDPDISAIPVVVVSASRDGREQSIQMGAAGFLQKPVDLDTLLSTIDRHCPPSGE